MTELPVRTVFSGSQCGTAHAGLQILSHAQFRQAWRRIGGGGEPEVDWSREVIGWLSMGARSSAGYGLRLAGDTAIRREATVRIVMERLRPAPHSLAAQVVTAPCLWFAVPRGGYRQIQIAEPDGNVFAVAAVED